MTLFSADTGEVTPPQATAEQLGEGPARDLRAALGIVRMDTEVMAVMSQDPSAIWYGAGLMVAVTVLSLLVQAVIRQVSINVVAVVVVALVSLAISAISTAAIHGAAKVIFGAKGKYVGLLRVLWLGSVVNVLMIVPVVGSIVAGLWSLLIMMVTFQEIDGIDRIQALGLSLGLSAGVYFLGIILSEALRTSPAAF